MAPSGAGLYFMNSYNEPFATYPSSSDNQFKPYKDAGRDANNEETSIDLKGVRNVHIFFNDENRIRVQKDNVQSCTVDLDNEAGEGCSQYINNQRSESDNHGTSWHIKIEKSKEPSAKGNTDMTSNNLRALEDNYGGILNAPENSDTSRINNGDKISAVKCNEISNGTNESPVLKLQIKKAEIVIKFGQKSSGTDLAALDDKHADARDTDASLNIQIDSREKDVSDPIVIDLMKNTYDQKKTINEKHDSQNPVQIRLDFRKDYEGLSSETDEVSSATALEAITWVDPDNVHRSEPGSGSQSPLLTKPVHSE